MQCKWCECERDAPACGPHVCSPVNVRQVAFRDAIKSERNKIADFIEKTADEDPQTVSMSYLAETIRAYGGSDR